MKYLNYEIKNIQNAALCSLLLWRFVYGFEKASKDNSSTPFPLLFIILPIVLREDTIKIVDSTRKSSGLRKFAGKFSESRVSKKDVLLSLQGSCKNMRDLTLESILLAISSKLISIDPQSSDVFSLSSVTPRAGIPDIIMPMMRCAERLGIWCSGISLYEISTILKVEF